MRIREAIPDDISSILQVLKASLGEASSKKSEEVWNFKHIINPFGKSLVLVAEENSQIIGVRAFMRWQWNYNNKIYNAFRAVDTATHPDHQGKGVFKKLTLKALDIAKQNGEHFVFNTPNDQSRPGYLKMGWEEVEKIKLILVPTGLILSRNSERKYFKEIDENKGNEGWLHSVKQDQHTLQTPLTREYLTWRYELNPLQEYLVKSNHQFFLAAYIKKHKYFNEFRVSELIFDDSDKALRKIIRKELIYLAKCNGANFISLSEKTNLNFNLGFKGNFGPMLVMKNINLNPKEASQFIQLKNWKYSLGDLELF